MIRKLTIGPCRINPKFSPGTIAATPAVMEKIDPDYAMAALSQHLQGEWGLLGRHDWEVNEDALKTGGRLLSVYPLPDEGENFWIITDAADEDGQRAVTTILLPSDY